MKRIATLWLCLAVPGLLGAGWLSAQTPVSPPARVDNVAVRLAGLEQDVQMIQTALRQLTLEIEQLRREQAEMRQLAESIRQQPRNVATGDQLTQLRTQLLAEDARNRQEIVDEVRRQVESLADQTQKALQTIARSIEGQPSAAPPAIRFSEDYPKEGIAYTVVQGDTLSGIARRFNSTVRDIQNANKIADPRDIRPGQNLFIPIARQP